MQDSRFTKSFKFSEKADYIFYLSELIIDLIQKKERIEHYLNEINSLIDANPKALLINSNLYESISDKIMRPLQYIFNLLGDESKKAVSYKKFRKLLYNKRNDLGIQLNKLSQSDEILLGQFNQIRNWGLHIPESLFIQKRAFFKMDSAFVIGNMRKIIIPRYDNFEIEFLHKLKLEIEEVLVGVETILSTMKKDYKSLIGQDFEIGYEDNVAKLYLLMNVVKDSWDVQNGKNPKSAKTN